VTDLRAYTTRRETTCVHCAAVIQPGTMVHIVHDDDGRPRAAHIACDLLARQEARGWVSEVGS
jgi:hypothetical protein